VAAEYIARAHQGDTPFCHPPILHMERVMLLVVVENRQKKLQQQWEKLNEAEHILGLKGI
jgi:hypothetical protein